MRFFLFSANFNSKEIKQINFKKYIQTLFAISTLDKQGKHKVKVLQCNQGCPKN